MTQSQEPNEDSTEPTLRQAQCDALRERRSDRQLRTIARRVNRLEDTQVTWGELNVEFDRLYDEVDELKADLKADISELKGEIATLNGKMDILIRHAKGAGAW